MVIPIPHQQIQPETLTSLIEEFVTRDGAVQGHVEMSLARRVAQILAQLARGEIQIVFDDETESCTILPVQSPI